jgi:mono/diheme cytochrome c family protein
VDAPALAFSEEFTDGRGGRQVVRRYTDCGLEAFLASPVPRRAHPAQAMYPVTAERRRELARALAGAVESCQTAPAASADQVRRGALLFAQSGCAGCHTGAGAAPRLRIGVPLLSSAYFRARVRLGGTPNQPRWQRVWDDTAGKLYAADDARTVMPPHPELSNADIDALYLYVSSDRSDVPSPQSRNAEPPFVDVPDELRLKLFREVQRRVFDTSCRHCHSPEPRDQQIIRRVFGAVKDSAPGVLPMSRAATPSREQLRKALGTDCQNSPLLQRLRLRANEWSGHAAPGGLRGMPLTLPPLSEDTIRLVETWRALGCPSDIGDLCSSCKPGGV